MALQEYEVLIGGLPHTIQLDEHGAKQLGLGVEDVKSAAPKASPKAPAKPRAPRKARTPRNKAVKPAENKAAPAASDASDPGASE